MKGLFIPEITVEMFRNACLESIEDLMAEGEVYDIEYDPKSAEQDVPDTNVGELIRRQDAIEAIEQMQMPIMRSEYIGEQFVFRGLSDALMAIKVLPSLPRNGRWILWNEPGCEHARCSVCGEQYDQLDLYIGGNEYPKFCPNCGADMRGDNNGSD